MAAGAQGVDAEPRFSLEGIILGASHGAERRAGLMVKRKIPTVEQMRARFAGLPEEAFVDASLRLLAALRSNRDTLDRGLTPGTTSSERAAERSGRPNKGDK